MKISLEIPNTIYSKLIELKPNTENRTQWFISLMLEGLEKIKEKELKVKLKEELLRELEAEGMLAKPVKALNEISSRKIPFSNYVEILSIF